MRLYYLKRTQFLPITIDEAWAFFSSPRNLATITPSKINFRILYVSGGTGIYAGQLISYKVTVFPFVTVNWTTEIAHVNKPYYFIDTQLSGPYKLWHHQHFFKEVPGGVEMTDEVNYAIPLGPIGWLANQLFVRREVNGIFDYRSKMLEEIFSKKLNTQTV